MFATPGDIIPMEGIVDINQQILDLGKHFSLLNGWLVPISGAAIRLMAFLNKQGALDTAEKKCSGETRYSDETDGIVCVKAKFSKGIIPDDYDLTTNFVVCQWAMGGKMTAVAMATRILMG